MMVPFEYSGATGIVSGLRDTRAAFATNRLRDPAHFRGEVRSPVLLREALAALYAVVVSDFKYHPRDRLEFRAWLESQDKKFLASLQRALRGRPRGRAAPWWAVGHFVERGVLSTASLPWNGA